MSKRTLWLDLGVWAALAGVFVTVLVVVAQLNRPPSYAELQARAEQSVMQDCRGWSATRSLHASMQENVCQCIATRARTSFNGIDDADFVSCRQRVAARMTAHPDIDREFAANFPPLCGTLEGRISGLSGDGSSQFCQCLQVSSSKIVATKAAYAFGGGEAESVEQNTRLQQCTGSMAFGEGWKVTAPGEATMHLPPYLTFPIVTLPCAALRTARGLKC